MKTTILKIMSAVLLFVGFLPQANAQDITGAWEGTLNAQGTEIPLTFHITKK